MEILVPFTLGVDGRVATTDDPDVINEQHVASLVSTYPGERVMHPDYGIPLADYLFTPGEDIVSHAIILDVRQQMTQWEPALTVTEIIPLWEGPGVAAVNVLWEATPAVMAATQDAVINVGGTVTNE